MDIIQIVILNTVMIPIIALLDYILLKDRIEKTLDIKITLWHFLPACLLELMCFNMGVICGYNLK